jgi:hypothetical protein
LDFAARAVFSTERSFSAGLPFDFSVAGAGTALLPTFPFFAEGATA